MELGDTVGEIMFDRQSNDIDGNLNYIGRVLWRHDHLVTITTTNESKVISF